MTTVTVTTTGAGSFTIPANVTSIIFEAWGAGANGVSTGTNQDSGGAGGGYISASIDVVPGDIIYYQVGARANVSGTAQSWFQKNNNLVLDSWIAGGAVGTTAPSNTNGVVGTLIASFVGGNGAAAQGGGGSRGGSGGGGSGGPLGDGSAGTAGSGSSGGAGGDGNNGTTSGNGVSNIEGGSGGNGGAGSGGAGTAGGAPGGGGGGGGSSSGAVGSGARGQIRYTYTAVSIGPRRQSARSSFYFA